MRQKGLGILYRQSSGIAQNTVSLIDLILYHQALLLQSHLSDLRLLIRQLYRHIFYQLQNLLF